MAGSRAGRAFGCDSSLEEKKQDILWTQLPVKEIAPPAASGGPEMNAEAARPMCLTRNDAVGMLPVVAAAAEWRGESLV